MNVEERRSGDELVVRIAVAGLDPARDVEIALVGTTLRIQVGHVQESTTSNGRTSSTQVVRHATNLPPGTTVADISARYDDGVLEVRVPPDAWPAGTAVAVISR